MAGEVALGHDYLCRGKTMKTVLGSPGYFTIAFHTKFFPSLLLTRLKGRTKAVSERGTSFVHSSVTEVLILGAIGIILIAVGLPPAVSRGSLIGWIMSGIGTAGILAICILSVYQRIGEGGRPTYDGFLVGVFFFFVVLGLTAAIFVGRVGHHPPGLLILEVFAGVAAGYVVGIFAGLWMQYLGFISKFLDGLALLSIIGMIVVDLVLLSG